MAMRKFKDLVGDKMRGMYTLSVQQPIGPRKESL